MSECDKPCGTCPFLKKNLGKPNPQRLEELKIEQPDFDWDDWYSEKNLVRLWKGTIKTATPMMCHSHDPNAASYGGKNAKPGTEKLCVGHLIGVFKHIKFQETIIEQGIRGAAVNKLYRDNAGEYPMKRDEVAAWVMMFAYGNSDIIGGGLPFPKKIDGEAVKQVGVPWNDSIINSES